MTAKPPEQLLLDRLKTPIGEMLLVFDREGRLRALHWGDHEPRMMDLMRIDDGSGVTLKAGRGPLDAIRELKAYFAGDLAALDRIECRSGGTVFQQAVWNALRVIPPGQTLSYGALAVRLGKPRAMRAVGHANGANPIPIVIPCHRLIGADGSLTGYGGGIERKRWLLTHEGVELDSRGRTSM